MNYELSILVFVQALLVLVVLGVLWELRAIRLSVKEIHWYWSQRAMLGIVRHINETSELPANRPPLAVWIYRGARWHLDPTSVPPGHEAGPPPDFAGSYQEQRYRVECVMRTS